MDGDSELLRRSQRGDEAAFDELYSRYATRLYSFLLRLTRSQATAEDLLQEVFVRLSQARDLQLSDGRLTPWLFRVARNAAISHGRSASRRKARHEAAHEAALSVAPRGGERAALRRLELAGLQEALSDLSDVQREVVLLKLVGGLTHAEIAAQQKVPVGTIKSRLHCALQTLRSRLKGERTCSAPTARRS